MNRPPEVALERSMARAANHLLLGGLVAIALLPPLLWATVVLLNERRQIPGPALLTLLPGTGVVALLSGLLTFALWAAVFNPRMRALRQAERRLRSMTKRDPLTGLLNRDGLRITLERAIKRRGVQGRVGVLLIDLDRFRLVNNSLGQPGGDALLCSVAARIEAVVRDRDVVARVGPDQFAVQAEALSSEQALAVMAANLLRAFEAPCLVAGQDITVGLSIGTAMAGGPTSGVDPLLKCAEVAMQAAKAGGGGGFRSFEAAMQVDDDARLALHRRLRHALEQDEFVLVFQPIVAARSGRIAAVEALVRWADPTLESMVSPAEFIPALEQTGLIVAVGNWVLRQACRQSVPWLMHGNHALVLSVNVSPRQFAEADFVESVMAIVEDTGFPAQRLQLEVTEGLLLEPSPDTLRKINALVDAGIRLAVDDFGMGYSSLAFLRSLPLHTLKIDRMFVRDIAEQKCDATIVRAIVDLGHGLGMHVTAEGVETEAQSQLLQQLGADTLQGYLFSRPLGADGIRKLLAERGTEGAGGDPPANWSTTMAALLHPA